MSIIRFVRGPWKFPVGLTGIFLVLCFSLLISGCHKESSSPNENKYLVDFKQENVFLLQTINALFGPLETEYPEAAGIKQHASYSVQVFSITYTTHYKGNEIHASGLACIPLADGKFPVISFQNGTNTLHANAPTEKPLDFNYLLLEAMASNGYIVLIPDYIGFGASSDLLHPYYQKESTCSAVIDIIHACGELVNNKTILAKENDTFYLMGYSQGGWATLAVLEQLEKGGQDDISVSAASCGAGAYDLTLMSDYVLRQDTFPGPLYLPYFIYSETVYGSLTDPLDKYFNEPYADNIPQLFDGSHSNDQINESLNDTISRLVTPDLIENFSQGSDFQNLRDVLAENSVSGWPVNSMLRFYHGTSDINVPPAQSQQIYDSFISAGADPARVAHFDLEGMTHDMGVIPWGIITINWFNELEGK
jgi:hypothetical protein